MIGFVGRRTLLAVLFSTVVMPICALAKEPVRLKGGVDETAIFTTLNESLGIHTEKKNGVVQIALVKLGTPAYYHGLQAGDAIVDEHADGKHLVITIRRGQQTFQTSLASATAPTHYQLAVPAGAPPTLKPMAENATLTVPASSLSIAAKQKIIAQHDVILIVDRSGSMNTADCPNKETRWQWVQQQSQSFARAAATSLPHGVTVVLFNNDEQVVPNLTLEDIPKLFAQFQPSGGTNTDIAVRDVAKMYFDQKALNPSLKPLAIAIITDGLPNQPDSLKQALIRMTQQMADPNEISVSFIQVAEVASAKSLLQELDEGLTQEGAKYDVVSVKYFDDVNREGLLNALVDAINTKR